MYGRPDWWSFLRISSDGWSSEFRSVDRLLRHLSRKTGSIASRNAYCYILWKLCESDYVQKRLGSEINPDQLILKAKEDPELITNIVQAFGDEVYRKRSVRYANHRIQLLKTFFKVNKVDSKLDLNLYSQPTRSRKRPEYIPTLEEALRMAEVSGNLRDRLIIEFLLYTGLRNSTLRALVYNEHYPEPLLKEYTIKRELERGEECIVIIVHEIMKERVPNACKNRIFYYTFIPPKVTADLHAYIREREKKYGPLRDDDPIFPTGNRRIPLSVRLQTPISSRELQEIVKKAAKRAGVEHERYVYPHCLRKTYESFLRNQPNDVKLDIKEREFLFGHVLPGSQDTYFDRTKIEEMRAKYARLNFEPIVIETEERVVKQEDLQSFLEQGWKFVAALSNGKVVISRKVKRQAKKVHITPEFDRDSCTAQNTPLSTKEREHNNLPRASQENEATFTDNQKLDLEESLTKKTRQKKLQEFLSPD